MIPRLFQVLVLITILFMFKEWAYVATYRLNLDHRVDPAVGSTAGERFDLEDSGVVPRIVAHDERVSFRTAIGNDASIRAVVTANGNGSYEIHVRPDGAAPLVRTQTVSGPTPVIFPFPSGNGIVEIVSHGELTWSDLRLERSLRAAPVLALLGVLLVGWWISSRATAAPALSWAGPVAMLVSIAAALVAVESGLRAASGRLPGSIGAIRRELGEPTEDPRWQSTTRYGRRLNPNVRDAANEWRDGDIIRMGFVPAVMSERGVHRYPFHTDREGFRNEATRDEIAIAALGDSFTDALTMAREASWPAQLEARLGVAVQNYGTAGFGPQQQRLVLQDFALSHHPRIVVLAFFAGNDIRDAERFEEFERGDGSLAQPASGWPIREIVIRADSWYLTSAIQAAVSSVAAGTVSFAHAEVPDASVPRPVADDYHARFDRGVFSVPVNGHVLRFAFMPPYLNLLNFSESDLAARRGWALLLENMRVMQRASRDAGAQFVLMFIPFKSQVYLPLLQRTFAKEALSEALHFSLKDAPSRPDIDRFARNRLAQNTLMQRFCEQAGIPFLDLTPVLQARVDSGLNIYFQDDSHFNEDGEALAAETLADFLARLGLATAARAESGTAPP